MAAESLGVRSMCTYVETPSLRILLDAGVSLSPNRFRLPPHPKEYKAIEEARWRIAEYAEKAEVVTISHYHFDHHTPSFVDWRCNWTDTETALQIYEGKFVLAKNYRVEVNASQRRRGWAFEETAGKNVEKIEFADGKDFSFGETKVRFSDPVFHGLSNTPLGWVLMTTIEHGDEKILFASDVQGPMDTAALRIILAEKPQLVIIGGPPVYLADFHVTNQQLQNGLRNLETIAQAVPIVVVDHHLLRDVKWQDWTKHVSDVASKLGDSVITAAEFLGERNRLLEAKRKQLFESEPPSLDFERWAKLPEFRQMRIKPPL